MRSRRVSHGRSSRSIHRSSHRGDARPAAILQWQSHLAKRESGGPDHAEADDQCRDEVTDDSDDRAEQTDQGPLGLHAAHVDREQRGHEGDDPAPVVPPALDPLPGQALAEAEQIGMLRQPQRSNHV
jgi:hypothetical protein